MMRILLVVLFGLACSCSVWANDAAITGVGGSWRRLEKESSSVRMESEVVTLQVQPSGFYRVTADFIFHNQGSASWVNMGFPETGSGVDVGGPNNSSSFQQFSSWVDGRRIPLKRVATKNMRSQEAEALWVKRIYFRAGQKRKARVSYLSSPGGSSLPHESWVQYGFTGGNWKDKVAKSTLIVDFAAPGTYLVKYDVPEKQHPPIFKRSGRRFIFTWKNWQAEGDFSFYYEKTLRNFLLAPAEKRHHFKDMRKIPVKIDVPGKTLDEDFIDIVPVGVQRNGQDFVLLSAWKEWITTTKRGRVLWDSRNRVRVIEYQGRRVKLDVRRHHVYTPRDITGEKLTYIPISFLERHLGGRFKVNLKEHLIQFL